jgi:hypothetical protein
MNVRFILFLASPSVHSFDHLSVIVADAIHHGFILIGFQNVSDLVLAHSGLALASHHAIGGLCLASGRERSDKRHCKERAHGGGRATRAAVRLRSRDRARVAARSAAPRRSSGRGDGAPAAARRAGARPREGAWLRGCLLGADIISFIPRRRPGHDSHRRGVLNSSMRRALRMVA